MGRTFSEIIQPTWDTKDDSVLMAPAGTDAPLPAGSADEPTGDVPMLDVPLMSDVPSAGKKHAHFEPPPSIEEAKSAHRDLGDLLRPWRKNGKGHLPFRDGDKLQQWMEQMKMFLHFFVDPDKHGRHLGWAAASLRTAQLGNKAQTGRGGYASGPETSWKINTAYRSCPT